VNPLDPEKQDYSGSREVCCLYPGNFQAGCFTILSCDPEFFMLFPQIRIPQDRGKSLIVHEQPVQVKIFPLVILLK